MFEDVEEEAGSEELLDDCDRAFVAGLEVEPVPQGEECDNGSEVADRVTG